MSLPRDTLSSRIIDINFNLQNNGGQNLFCFWEYSTSSSWQLNTASASSLILFKAGAIQCFHPLSWGLKIQRYQTIKVTSRYVLNASQPPWKKVGNEGVTAAVSQRSLEKKGWKGFCMRGDKAGEGRCVFLSFVAVSWLESKQAGNL